MLWDLKKKLMEFFGDDIEDDDDDELSEELSENEKKEVATEQPQQNQQSKVQHKTTATARVEPENSLKKKGDRKPFWGRKKGGNYKNGQHLK